MKKIIPLIFSIVIGLSLFAQKKITYVTYGSLLKAGWEATASPLDNDPVLAMLKADNNFTVTAVIMQSKTEVVSFSDADLLIIQESIGGPDAVLKPSGYLGIAKLDKPTIYNKVFSLKQGRALTSTTIGSGGGGGYNEASLHFTVNTNAKTNALFKGCTFENNDIKVFNEVASDLGGAGTALGNGIQYAFSVGLTGANTLLAVPKGTLTNPPATVCINDVPKGTYIESEATAERIIFLSMNFGAICKNNGANITSDGLRLWKNAAYILTGISVSTSIEENNSKNLFAVQQGNFIQFQFGEVQNSTITVLDINGRQLMKNKVSADRADVDLNNLPKGMYVINVAGEKISGSRKMMVQ